jgi:hypothetical protein
MAHFANQILPDDLGEKPEIDQQSKSLDSVMGTVSPSHFQRKGQTDCPQSPERAQLTGQQLGSPSSVATALEWPWASPMKLAGKGHL